MTETRTPLHGLTSDEEVQHRSVDKVTDPARKSLDVTESIAKDIEARVDALLTELLGDQR